MDSRFGATQAKHGPDRFLAENPRDPTRKRPKMASNSLLISAVDAEFNDALRSQNHESAIPPSASPENPEVDEQNSKAAVRVCWAM
jgi:hypothetical protein